MFTLFGLGVMIILLNYLPGAPGVAQLGGLVGLPKDTANEYLLIGLGLISLGFIVSTRYR